MLDGAMCLSEFSECESHVYALIEKKKMRVRR